MARSNTSLRGVMIAFIIFSLLLTYSSFPTSDERQIANILQAEVGSLMVNVSDEAGSAIEAANISITDKFNNVNYSETGANGSILIGGLEVGGSPYEIEASKPGYENSSKISSVSIDANTTKYEELILLAGMISGTIYEFGSGLEVRIADAKIEIFGISGTSLVEFNTSSSSNGDYLVRGLPVGEYNIYVSALGYESASGEFNISFERPEWRFRTESFSLLGYSFGSISGHVLEGSIPVPEVEVSIELTAGTTLTVYSDLTGKYRISEISGGNYTVFANKKGYFEGLESNVTVVNGEETINVNISVTSKPGRLFGTVISGVILIYDANVELSGTTLNASTGAQGSYSIENIPAGNYSILITKTGYETSTMHGITIERGESRELHIELIAKPGQLIGVITSADTFSIISGCNVTIIGTSESRNTITNELGQYGFAGLPAGSYTIIVRHQNYAPYISSDVSIAAENETTLNIQLELVKEALGGFIEGLDLAHSMMALAFMITIVILGVAVYLRLKGIQHPESSPAVFEEEGEEEEIEEE